MIFPKRHIRRGLELVRRLKLARDLLLPGISFGGFNHRVDWSGIYILHPDRVLYIPSTDIMRHTRWMRDAAKFFGYT